MHQKKTAWVSPCFGNHLSPIPNPSPCPSVREPISIAILLDLLKEKEQKANVSHGRDGLSGEKEIVTLRPSPIDLI
jgi:hypothetical protein